MAQRPVKEDRKEKEGSGRGRKGGREGKRNKIFPKGSMSLALLLMKRVGCLRKLQTDIGAHSHWCSLSQYFQARNLPVGFQFPISLKAYSSFFIAEMDSEVLSGQSVRSQEAGHFGAVFGSRLRQKEKGPHFLPTTARWLWQLQSRKLRFYSQPSSVLEPSAQKS